jgi:hypothetical protein
VKNYSSVGQAIDDNNDASELHAGYIMLQIHTLSLCNNHYFSTTTMVARKRLYNTLYVLCLYFYKRMRVLIDFLSTILLCDPTAAGGLLAFYF